jgi:hypothetical protein
MGQELRSIVLTDAEFAFATGLYFDGRRGAPIKAGNIGAVHGPDKPNGQATVALKVPLVDGQASVTLGPRELVDIIVRFCKEKAVPLPRSGRKTVLRRDGNVVLEIELDWF